MSTEREEKALIAFLKTISTATQGLDFAEQSELDKLPAASAYRIEELEDLLSRLSSEAEALLWRMGVGHELYRRGK